MSPLPSGVGRGSKNRLVIVRRAGLTSIPPKKTETPGVNGSPSQPRAKLAGVGGPGTFRFFGGTSRSRGGVVRRARVFFCLLGVFVVVLARFGSGLWSVCFVFRWRRGCGVVRVACPSRSACVRLLWRFRSARAWVRRFGSRLCWGGVRCSRPGVVSSLPLFGLRWLSCRPLSVCVSGPDCGRVALFFVRSAFAF